jgi:nucleoside-diphosphate-sugar epimerase
MATVVTGAAGFIGRAVVRRLLAGGDHVIAIDRRWLAPEHRLTVLTGDLSSAGDSIRTALADADRVLHLAGCPGVRGAGPGLEARRRRDNVDATAAVLAAVPPRTPLVVTSSSSVYGGADAGRASAEDAPLLPRGGYARSKVTAERLCARRAASGGLVCVARPFTVAGEGQRPDMAIARWIDAARHGRTLRIHGSWQRTRDVTDVRDVAEALTRLADLAITTTVNIGTGVGHSLREMVDAVAAALGVDPRVAVRPADPAEVVDTLADPRRLGRILGWVPRTDLAGLVARQVAAADGPIRPRAAVPA